MAPKQQLALAEKFAQVGNRKVMKWVFGLIFLTIALGQIFYWVFANQIEPILFGMPISMVFITALIILEFVFLLIMYLLENQNQEIN